jgi:hypothetical protein
VETMTKFNKGDKVRITNYSGNTDVHEDPKYRTVGAEGYVEDVYQDTNMVDIVIPTNLYYSAPNSFIAYDWELELLEEAHPLTKESVNS